MGKSITEKARSQLCRGIRDGRFPIDAWLPPVETLASKAGCGVETMRRVLRRLAQEGIVKSVRHRGTRILRSPSVGRVCLFLSDDPHANLLLQSEVCHALAAAGFDVDLIPALPDRAASRSWTERVLNETPVPVCMVSLSPLVPPKAATDGEAEQQIAGLLPPHVVFDLDAGGPASVKDSTQITIGVDVRQEARQVVEHLLALGHRKVAAFADFAPGRNSRHAESAAYCRDLLEVAGAEFVPFHTFGSKPQFLTLIREQRVTAFLDLNDSAATQTLLRLQSAGMRVPDDVSLIGRNDTPWSRECIPQLTTVSLNPAGIGRAIADAVQELAAGGTPASFRTVEPRLIARGSTGPARRNGRGKS